MSQARCAGSINLHSVVLATAVCALKPFKAQHVSAPVTHPSRAPKDFSNASPHHSKSAVMIQYTRPQQQISILLTSRTREPRPSDST